MYWLLGALPAKRAGARRLGMVTLEQMIGALMWAVETSGPDSRVMEVPEIRDRAAR
jgi:hypothetical protein